MYLITTTSNDKEILIKIAKKLVEKEVSKCVQLSECNSFYKWDNKLNEALEYKLSIKSKNIKKVYKIIKKYHNYECFEFIYQEIKASKEYLDYLKEKK